MRLAVTGGAGFVGRKVLAELARRGVSATVLARDPAAAGDLHGLPVVAGAIEQDPHSLFERLGSPETLIHLAWAGLPNYKSLHHFSEELPKQYAFLAGMVDAGVKHIVVAGTCFEYGMIEGRLSESQTPSPTNPYGFAKDVLRQQLEFLKAKQAFSLAWARLFYMYGEGQSPRSLWSLLQDALASGASEFPMSGGEQIRDFLAADEVAAHLADLALYPDDIGVVNICSGKPKSVRALVESWVVDSGKQISLKLGAFGYPDYEPFAFWGDRSRLDAFSARRAHGFRG